MTPQQADKAIASGKPILVQSAPDAPFMLRILSRDRRHVTGTYEHDGRTFDAKFERADLIVVD